MTATNGFRLRHLLPPSRQASAFTGLSLAEQATHPTRPHRGTLPAVVLDPCPEREGHGHHWALEAPAGPTTRGRCRACGKEREYQTSSDGSVWENRTERGE